MKINKSYAVDYETIIQSPTPQATRTWKPVPHSDVMNTVIEEALHRDLDVREIKYQLVDVYDKKVRQPYQDMFATMFMQSSNGTFENMLGIRNSHNQRFGAAACSGSRVIVCSNMVFSGEHVISSKHTKNVHANFNNRVSGMFDNIINNWTSQEHRYDGYKDTEINSRDVYHIVGEACRNNQAIPASKLNHVIDEYESPSHPDFEPGNAWSLFNAFTEIYKQCPTSIADSSKRGIALHSIFDSFCSDQIQTRVNQSQPEQLQSLLAVS